MLIRWVCECGKSLSAREESAGKRAKCPQCSRSIAIPAPAPAESPQDDPGATQLCPLCREPILAVALKCRHCGEFLDRRPPGRPGAPARAVPAASPWTKMPVVVPIAWCLFLGGLALNFAGALIWLPIGMVGGLLTLASPIVALIGFIVSLTQSRRSILGAGLSGGLMVLFAGAAIVGISALIGARADSVGEERCRANMEGIGAAAELYRMQYERIPEFDNPHFFTLLRGEMRRDSSIFVCPSAEETPGGSPQDVSTSYETWSSGDLPPTELVRFGFRIPIAWDRLPDHHDYSRNVLFGDGHVESLEEDAFQDLLDREGKRLRLCR